jgi:uncharacterized protein (DUF433 family)
MTIARDDDVLGGEPRINGTRVGVRHVAAMMTDSGRSPAQVVDQFDLPISDVSEALSYYCGHIEEMHDLARENDSAFDRVRKLSLKPKEPVQ